MGRFVEVNSLLSLSRCSTSSRYFSSSSEEQLVASATPSDPAYWLKQLRESRKREEVDAVLAKMEESLHQAPTTEVHVQYNVMPSYM